MKYFTYELISTSNGWTDASDARIKKVGRNYERAWAKYIEQLDLIEGRISKPAFKFFRFGFGSTGLHDANLLSFKTGDGLDFVVDGTQPFKINRARFESRIELINFDQDRHYAFKLKGVSEVRCKLRPGGHSFSGSLGDLYTYELTDAGDGTLRIGLLFQSGGEIEVTFKKLIFRMKRFKNTYDEAKVHRFSL